ncbi:MAG: ABC transporter permease [Phycisphaerae bacterium]|nr:ABC transporter permease [Phycisphaerae bacterium]
MSRLHLARRSLSHYLPSHLGTLLGITVAVAALTGALLVGDSLRASLRDHALRRLGGFTHALIATRTFPDTLAQRIQGTNPAPLLLMPAALANPASGARAQNATALGIDQRFSVGLKPSFDFGAIPRRGAVLNAAAARALGAKSGDELLLRLDRPSAVSADTLMGRREDRTLTLRLRIHAVITPEQRGDFNIRPGQAEPLNVFLPIAELQNAIEQPGAANLLLFQHGSLELLNPPNDATAVVQKSIAPSLTLADFGLKLREIEKSRTLVLESDSMLLAPAILDRAAAAAKSISAHRAAISAYLATSIEKLDDADESPIASRPIAAGAIPYSTICAVPGAGPPLSAMLAESGDAAQPLRPGEVAINAWTARELGAARGDRILIRYDITGEFGKLESRADAFTIARVVEMTPAATDRTFVPDYPGITDTDDLADWDPPFPLDLKRIQPRDEKYWDDYRAAPKVFVTLEDAERMWGQNAATIGMFTSLRITPKSSRNAPATDAAASAPAAAFEHELLRTLTLDDGGLTLKDLHAEIAKAARGNTDFGGLFIGFSFFLIAAAMMLIVLLFRLAVERRVKQVGLLAAVGFSPRAARSVFFAEGALLAAIGALLGVAAAAGYAWLMLAGLRGWWSAAAQAPFLRLHITPATAAIGAGVGFALALLSIAIALRGLQTNSAARLLTGGAIDAPAIDRRPRWPMITLTLGLLATAIGIVGGALGWMPAAGGFFLAGAGGLAAALALFRTSITPRAAEPSNSRFASSTAALAWRNLQRSPGRAILIAGLIASATFLLTALEAFRLSPADPHDRAGGAGGCALVAETSTPLAADPNTAAGRAALGVDDASHPDLREVRLWPFRLRPGDRTSCLNLYQPGEPRILGAPRAFIERGGFAFAGVMKAAAAASQPSSAEDRGNPWRLLEQPADADGAIPAIGDEAAVQWQLHKGLGQTLTIRDENGVERPLRFVALLSGSVLQSELIISEENFRRLFPSRDGYSVFLIETPRGGERAASDALERAYEHFGLDAELCEERLRAFFAVQNTYLSTFQTLGGFGLLLGTCGLAGVVLRALLERRRELALMSAVGFSAARLERMVLLEHAYLAVAGLMIGALPALLAIGPQLAARARGGAMGNFTNLLPLLGSARLVLIVAATALLATWLALRGLRRMNLVGGLRGE